MIVPFSQPPAITYANPKKPPLYSERPQHRRNQLIVSATKKRKGTEQETGLDPTYVKKIKGTFHKKKAPQSKSFRLHPFYAPLKKQHRKVSQYTHSREVSKNRTPEQYRLHEYVTKYSSLLRGNQRLFYYLFGQEQVLRSNVFFPSPAKEPSRAFRVLSKKPVTTLVKKDQKMMRELERRACSQQTLWKDYSPKKIEIKKTLDAPGAVDDFYRSVFSSKGKDLYIGLGDILYELKFKEEARELFTCSLEQGLITCVEKTKNGLLFGTESEELFFLSNLNNENIEPSSVQGMISGMPVCSKEIQPGVFLVGTKQGIQGTPCLFLVKVADKKMTVDSLFNDPAIGSVIGISVQKNADGGCDLLLGTGENVVLYCKYDGDNVHFIADSEDFIGASVKALCWHPREKDLFVTGGGSKDPTVRLWRIQGAKLKQIACLPMHGQVTNVRFNPSGKELLITCGSPEGQVVVVEFRSLMMREWRQKKLTEYCPCRITSSAVLSNGELFCLLPAEELVRIYDMGESWRKVNPQKFKPLGLEKYISVIR